jgi:polysaccharide pyruvyl transferase WcaK-like protein
MRAGIYLGWVGFDNLGDEAIYSVCKRRFSELRWSSFERLEYTPQVAQFIRSGTHVGYHLVRVLKEEFLHQTRVRNVVSNRLHHLASGFGGRVGLLGGGTIINQGDDFFDSYVTVRRRTKSLVPVFGAGVGSPDFWSAKSEWKDRRKDWVAVLDELPIVGVRGPLSKNLLDDAGSRNVVVCGDPAVALHSRYAKKLPTFQPDRPLKVAINTGDCSGNLWGNMDDVQRSLTKLALWLDSQGHQIEFIPVWPNDVAPCIEIARKAGLDQSTVCPVLSSHTSFLRKIETFDVVVALKLHAAILSAVANIPCVFLAYQPKTLDFAASLDWEQFAIRTNELNAPKIIEIVSLLIDQLPSKRKELCVSMCKLSKVFEAYCQKIEPILLGKAA